MTNRLGFEQSPYLLQHSLDPVDWYPWGSEAFDRARREDKPIFLSIGYSTCHWCHVMARESFRDTAVADILNERYVPIKVDREERPDIDGVYMAFCMAYTGSGGWPMSIIMTPERKPFFAGTYFPKTTRYGSPGLMELLSFISDKWERERDSLLSAADRIVEALNAPAEAASGESKSESEDEPASGGEPASESDLIEAALSSFRASFDSERGGFGGAPKFPAPHNLLFLMQQYEKHGERDALRMAEKTLTQMYLGGLFDHIGYGFCRYSTDAGYLAPHFEKMLYDNALLILAYSKAYELTGSALYLSIAKKTADYIAREMTSPDGAFYSAQDADSDGEEGKYYLFTPDETLALLGNDVGADFNQTFDITPRGNFEGRSIPNLLRSKAYSEQFNAYLPQLREYRRERAKLDTDDKILLFWNSLMICALTALYRKTREERYIKAAREADASIRKNMTDSDALYASYRNGKRGARGFLDDYAGYALALLSLYDATLDAEYLNGAIRIAKKTVSIFFDPERGGFYVSGGEHERLVLRLKDTSDGATPSGNSIIAYVLSRLIALAPDAELEKALNVQLAFMQNEARRYPAGYAAFLTALSDCNEPPAHIVAVTAGDGIPSEVPFIVPLGGSVRVLTAPTPEYGIINGKTTYYVCAGRACLPPVNELTKELISAVPHKA